MRPTGTAAAAQQPGRQRLQLTVPASQQAVPGELVCINDAALLAGSAGHPQAGLVLHEVT